MILRVTGLLFYQHDHLLDLYKTFYANDYIEMKTVEYTGEYVYSISRRDLISLHRHDVEHLQWR